MKATQIHLLHQLTTEIISGRAHPEHGIDSVFLSNNGGRL